MWIVINDNKWKIEYVCAYTGILMGSYGDNLDASVFAK